MLGHIFPVDFIHCIYIIKKLHAHTSREFIFGADTSREYCQGNHDQRNASMVYSIKSKSIIITNMIIHQSVCIGVMVLWVYVELQQLRETYSVKAETFANVTVRLHV